MIPGYDPLSVQELQLPWPGVVPYPVIPEPGYPDQIDDSVRKVLTAEDIRARRRMAVSYLAQMPKGVPAIHRGVASPLATCPNLLRCDGLSSRVGMVTKAGLAISVSLYAVHYIPDANRRNRCVLFCEGHGWTNDDDESSFPLNNGTGIWRTVTSLIADGFDVISYYMPGYWTDPVTGVQNQGAIEPDWVDPPIPRNTGPASHDWLFDNHDPQLATGSTWRAFLTMPILCLNYAETLGFDDLNAVGLSGGGWTTTLISAIDTRISRSYAVAGSTPLYAWPHPANGDQEQRSAKFFSYCGYLDLYFMATSDGRHAEQIWNRNEGVVAGQPLFDTIPSNWPRSGGKVYDEYVEDFSSEISTAAASVTGGTFVVRVDPTAPNHNVPWTAVRHIISDLKGESKTFKALVACLGSNAVTPLTWANGTWTAGSPVAVGAGPRGVVISYDGYRALVTNYGASPATVSPLTWSNGLWSVGTAITVNTGPWGAAMPPSGLFALIPNYATNTVTPLSWANGTWTAGTPIAVGTGPSIVSAVATDLTGWTRALVASIGTGVNAVTPVSYNNGVWSAGSPVAVGTQPWGVAISSDAKRALVCNYGSNNVTPLSWNGTVWVAGSVIAVGTQPRGCAMAPNGLRALVANYGSASVTPFSWANGTWTAGTPIAVGVNPIGVAISSDGLLALVTNYAAGSGTTVTPLTWANGVWTAGAPITVGTGPFSVSIAQASG